MTKLEKEEIFNDVVLETAFVADTTCATCHAEFLDFEDLEVHVQQMHSEFTKNCQFCEGTHSDLLDYAVHIRDVHLMDLRSCLYCVKVFLDGGRLKIHEKKHFRVDKTLYSCSQCDSMFNESRVLELHECKNHDNDIDGLVLKAMPYLSSILCLKVHLLLKTVGKKTFKCTTCGFTSVSLNSYIKHLNVKACKVCVCNKCSGVFKDKKNVIKHMKTAKMCKSVDDYSDEATPCKDCSVLVHPKAMQTHLRNCNALKCNECDIVYKTIDELSSHHSKHHPLDMSLVRCKFCLKEYFGEKSVQKHIEKIHKPDFHLYKYKCIECNLIFKHPQKLFAHYFSRHKDLHPFTCKICNKTFRVRKGFSLHIKLDHKSVGFVEFNDQYHVFFTDKKSNKPFVPECVLTAEEMREYESEESETQEKQTTEVQLSDTDMTDAETPMKPVKRKLTPKQMKSKKTRKTLKKPVCIYSSDEEPLLEIRKRVRNKGKIRRQWNWKKNSIPKKQFTCTVCNEHCYTFQNHQNHMSLHNKNQELECVKCSEKFNNKNDLTRHMQTDHATSKLTETLKNLIQKKKHEDGPSDDEPIKSPPKPERFKITMKKVKIHKSEIPAKITLTEKNLSVKNFIENFTPDINETAPKENLKVSSVSIKRYNSPYWRESTIKLTKFKDVHISKPVALKMPQRFKQYDNYVKTKINIKLVQTPVQTTNFLLPDYNEHNYSDSFQDNDYDDRNNDIPEVAQEVSLEGTEEIPSPKPALSGPTKIIIPKMPKGYSKLHIATLQPEAPFFKIIKVDSDNLDGLKLDEEPVQAPVSDVINLPGGTKLVNANPLAHLLGNTPVEKIFEPIKNKHYKPVIKDIQSILAQAMQKLEAPPPPPKYRKRNRSKKTQSLDKKVES